jgi:phage terminase small subunit
MPLTPKQQRFVDEYLIDLNATQAAIRCGYSERSAGQNAGRLMKNDEISHAIEQAVSERAIRTKVTQDWVIENLVNIAERCQQKQPVMEFDRAERQMVQATDAEGRGVWQFDSAGANRAVELVGKHLRMFTDKVEHSGEVAVKAKVNVYIPSNSRT